MAVSVLAAFVMVAATVAWSAWSPGHAGAAPAAVYVFPVPGGAYAMPKTQITFRGLPLASLGAITVTGSSSGAHTGTWAADSDRDGASFLPSQPFTAGETVTVRTALNVVGGNQGTFTFQIANPVGYIPLSSPSKGNGSTSFFHSRHDLHPVSIQMLKNATSASEGDIFVGPQLGPAQYGPMILDPKGNLVWFNPDYAPNETVTDFRVQTYKGQPVLTWWHGRNGAGVGEGSDVIVNNAYQQVASVSAGNGLSADMHEFQLTRENTALITAYDPVYMTVNGQRQVVFDSVVQEIDIPTGLVLFQWDSLDHVGLSESEVPTPTSTSSWYDYFHVNSVAEDNDGNLLVSARNTWAVYKVNRDTGAIIWRLGGKRSSFSMRSNTPFAFQHDAREHGANDNHITVFDDGGGPPSVHSQARALTLYLDLGRMNAWWAGEGEHSPPLSVNYQGNDQLLPSGNTFVGWGQQPYFTEFDSQGHQIFDARMSGTNSSYRVYRFPWSATPGSGHPPAVAVGHTSSGLVVYTSWNGATNVAGWRVLGGSSPGSQHRLAGAAKQGFETRFNVPNEAYISVLAIDSGGHVIGTSRTVTVH